jgi:hypothetical protein
MEGTRRRVCKIFSFDSPIAKADALGHNFGNLKRVGALKMSWMKVFSPIAAIAVVAVLCSSAFAQSAEKYKARLSVVPIASVNSRNTVDGIGSAAVTLTGSSLTVNGTFEGLKSPATAARLHRGVMTGVRGPALMDLTITPAPKGTITGTVNLTAEQVADLKQGRLYIQIYSQGAPEGNLWGWILK